MQKAELLDDVSRLKDLNPRQFQSLTTNFYVMKAAIRYFSVKKGMSFTSNKISENFPLTSPVAGLCLSAMEDLDIVSVRKQSSSPDRYMPQDVDMDRLEEVEKVLVDNFEIEEF